MRTKPAGEPMAAAVAVVNDGLTSNGVRRHSTSSPIVRAAVNASMKLSSDEPKPWGASPDSAMRA